MLSQAELQGVVTDSLATLGVSEQAKALYLLSLRLGPASIAKLAEQLGVSRSQGYHLIDELESFGLASFSERKKFSRCFVVASPSALQERLRQHEVKTVQTDQRLAFAMPDLLTLYQQGELSTGVRVIEGRDQFLKVFFQLLDETKEACFLGSAKDFIAFISWAEERRWIKERQKRGIRLRVLLLPSDDTDVLKKTDAEELRETRILRGAAPFVTLYQVYANKLVFWQPKTPSVVLLEDEYLAQMMKSLFEVLWERAKE